MGRIFPCTVRGMARALGLQSWRPQGKSKVLVGQVREILDEYNAYLPMTARQIFYRMVGVHGYDKTEDAYKRLLELLNRARRGGYISFDAMRDDGAVIQSPYGFPDGKGLVDTIRSQADDFRLKDRLANQHVVVEVWVEAAGMLPQVRNMTERWTVPVCTSGGFNSTTMKYDAAVRFLNRYRNTGRRTILLHLGDHDPSGMAIFRNIEADVSQMIMDLDDTAETVFDPITEFVRVAVTVEQAEELELESAPPKPSDSRTVTWEGETYQCEAIDPETLAGIVKDAVTDHISTGLFDEMMEEEEREKEWLRRTYPEWWQDVTEISELG